MKRLQKVIFILIIAAALFLSGCTSEVQSQKNMSIKNITADEKNLKPAQIKPPEIKNNVSSDRIIENNSTLNLNVSYENKTLNITNDSWVPGTKWINISTPDGHQIKAAVVYPDGTGPFPVIIIFHGTDGFRQAYVNLAKLLSKKGFISIAACWFSGSYSPNSFSDNINCPNGFDFTGANLDAAKNMQPLITTAKNLPGAKKDSIGLIGSSRGSTLSLLIASTSDDIKAVVSTSAIYSEKKVLFGKSFDDTLPINYAQNINVPVLILHSKIDPLVNVQEAYDYEAKLKQLGKTYDSHYYDDAPHPLLVMEPTEGDARERAANFFAKYLN